MRETIPAAEEIPFQLPPPLSYEQGEDIYKRVIRDHMGTGFGKYVTILMRIARIPLNYEIEIRTRKGGTRCSLLTLIQRQLAYDQTAALIGDEEAPKTRVSYERTWRLIQHAYAVTEGRAPLTDKDDLLGDAVQMAMVEKEGLRRKKR